VRDVPLWCVTKWYKVSRRAAGVLSASGLRQMRAVANHAPFIAIAVDALALPGLDALFELKPSAGAHAGFDGGA
jgi:hypothetical protein